MYNFLDINKNQYKDYNFEYGGNIIEAEDKKNHNWFGDLEISVCHLIFNYFS